MKILKIKLLTLLAIGSLLTIGCSDNDSLDQTPIDPNATTSADVYKDVATAKGALAKLYASLAVTGQTGPAGNNDLNGVIDEGTGSYQRLIVMAQDATTDDLKLAWPGDASGSLDTFIVNQWDSSNNFVTAAYYRFYVNIAFCNDFLRQSAGLASDPEMVKMRAEARFLRALMYYNIVDMFGKGPFITENDPTGKYSPPQKDRTFLFEYVESELKDIEGSIAAPKTSVTTSRADQGVVWTLLSRLYLNAKVYTGTDRYADAATYAKKVIDAYGESDATVGGLGTKGKWKELFMTDNRTNTNVSKELIFCINFDGSRTQSYGGAAFLINASLGGSMTPTNWGGSGWYGSRLTPEFVNLFEKTATNGSGEPTAWKDDRAQGVIWTDGQTFNMTNWKTFTNGYAYPKFYNKSSTGVVGSDPTFPDLDLPIMRLAEVYLTYAEAVLSTNPTAALKYVNYVRARANATPLTSVTAQDILDERGRELAWEGFRRTDLIRFGKYTGGTYNWQWKGGVQGGTSIDEKYKVFPIPQRDLNLNPNLTKTDGY